MLVFIINLWVWIFYCYTSDALLLSTWEVKKNDFERRVYVGGLCFSHLEPSCFPNRTQIHRLWSSFLLLKGHARGVGVGPHFINRERTIWSRLNNALLGTKLPFSPLARLILFSLSYFHADVHACTWHVLSCDTVGGGALNDCNAV